MPSSEPPGTPVTDHETEDHQVRYLSRMIMEKKRVLFACSLPCYNANHIHGCLENEPPADAVGGLFHFIEQIGREYSMCGIVGFTGNHQAAPILLDGLARLEYRGYDSAGLAVRDGSRLAEVVRRTTGPRWQEPVGSGIPAGPPTENPVRPTPIPMSAATAPDPDPVRWKRMWSVSTTASSRITQN